MGSNPIKTPPGFTLDGLPVRSNIAGASGRHAPPPGFELDFGARPNIQASTKPDVLAPPPGFIVDSPASTSGIPSVPFSGQIGSSLSQKPFSHTGKPVYNEVLDGSAQIAAKYLDLAWKEAMPSMAPGGLWIQQIKNRHCQYLLW